MKFILNLNLKADISQAMNSISGITKVFKTDFITQSQRIYIKSIYERTSRLTSVKLWKLWKQETFPRSPRCVYTKSNRRKFLLTQAFQHWLQWRKGKLENRKNLYDFVAECWMKIKTRIRRRRSNLPFESFAKQTTPHTQLTQWIWKRLMKSSLLMITQHTFCRKTHTWTGLFYPCWRPRKSEQANFFITTFSLCI